ncbi:MAG: 3-deoxy-manno-octulosonate cytidylyltransferase [Bacteroides sp.]|nr:3-deoxy-manno-octulosonate cytidylyltransferase [Bacteroides sp.]
MKIIGVIPARYQSSRFPGKPLALIQGKPMIWWVYQQAMRVSSFSEVYVATDSNLIYNNCVENNVRVLMTSEKHNTGTDRLGEVARLIDADFYVNIQGDEPLIEPETIQSIIDFKNRYPETQVINTCTPLNEDIEDYSNVKVVYTDSNDLLYLSRLPVPFPKKGQAVQYYKHLGLYGLSKEALLFFSSADRTKNEKIEDIEMLRFLENGYRIKIYPVNSKSIGVDNPEDIIKVENILRGC